MGVPGLWDILRPAGQQRSLAQLAVHDGFERNPGGRRGLRVGIDASIWFYHATHGREGENPELRTLFFRCARLMSRPFLPLFVFDGPRRPELKRKKKISGKDHWMVSGMQEIIEAFGFEWWSAPGEAEAELAYLNKIGVIDAIITDDVDTFLFGATMVIRNPGKLLTGNNAHPVKNAAGRDDGEHTYTYTSSSILEHPDVALSQDGLILIALLRGGDYDPMGFNDCGPSVAHALARCGFGDKLLSAARNLPPTRLSAFLDGWRTEVRAELRSNARGFLNTKKLKLAKSLPDTFPDIEVLQLYTHPETSERKNKRPIFHWDREPDLMKLAALCERKFEWGVREIIVKRFRTVMWAPAVLRILRRAVLDADAAGPLTPSKKRLMNDGTGPPGTPSKMIARHFSSLSIADEDDAQRFIVGIHGRREHASTDGMLEYRLEIAPSQLVRLTEAGVQGIRNLPSQYKEDSDEEDDYGVDDDDGEGGTRRRKRGELKNPQPPPDSHLRVWMPACIIERVEPAMVAAYEGRVAQKVRDKEDRAARKAARAATGACPKAKAKAKMTASGVKPKKASARRALVSEEEEEEEEGEEELSAEEDYSHIFGLPSKSKSKITRTARPGGRVKSRPMPSVGEEEEEEEEDKPATSKPRGNPRSKATPLSEATNSIIAPQSRPKTSTKAKTKAGKSQVLPTLLTSMEPPKRRTILDMLDEHRSSRVTSSTTSLSSPVKQISQSTSLFLPKPFPMSSEDNDDGVGERVCVPAPHRISPALQNENTVKSTARIFSTLTSDSDDAPVSLRASPKKSPRSSIKHDSPSARSKAVSKTSNSVKPLLAAKTRSEASASESELDVRGRPASPSPIRPRTTSILNDMNRITMSPSSAQVQSMSSGSVASMISGAAAQPSTSLFQLQTADIIEITSSSESECDVPPALRPKFRKKSAKAVVPVSVRHVPSRSTARRVDAIFPIVKPKTVAAQVALFNKTGSSKNRRYDTDDVIEILSVDGSSNPSTR